MLRRSMSLAHTTLLLYLSDPAPLLVFILMPLGLMAFLAPASRALLVSQGYAYAGGAEQAVPGMTVMFTFFVIGVIGVQFYREQGWGTWDRLRIASGTMEILVGKIVPGLLLLVAQLAVVFAAGALLFHLHVEGSLPALVLIALAFAVCILALTMALISWCRTLDQLNVLANVLAIVLSGLGGSFAPVNQLPSWAQAAAHASPAYWALQGMRAVILEGAGMRTAASTCLALAAFAGAFALLTAVRFNAREAKVSET
ncbi:MAG TPA: ABC transporter permease [Spirochaetia bacterium]|nr:ABC transporter permease [Spirochaetia bacterium]